MVWDRDRYSIALEQKKKKKPQKNLSRVTVICHINLCLCLCSRNCHIRLWHFLLFCLWSRWYGEPVGLLLSLYLTLVTPRHKLTRVGGCVLYWNVCACSLYISMICMHVRMWVNGSVITHMHVCANPCADNLCWYTVCISAYMSLGLLNMTSASSMCHLCLPDTGVKQCILNS